MSVTTGLSRGVTPDRHLQLLINDVDDLKLAVDTLSFLRGPLHLASPLRIGDLEISVAANPDNPAMLDVMFTNLTSGLPPVVVWTIA
jgi:hypothetical protein